MCLSTARSRARQVEANQKSSSERHKSREMIIKGGEGKDHDADDDGDASGGSRGFLMLILVRGRTREMLVERSF